ncbi:MAG TPA: hypothetical protein VNI78_10350 [Vicinamibacterales bacterium]|nr:hypothetical protein [Vicinamibacterales bacterium]
MTPYLRGAPPGLPFSLDPAALARGLNFTLTTSLGDLDLRGDVAGGGGYENLIADAESAVIAGVEVRYVPLRRLIALKRAAGRPRDLDMIAALEALLEERNRRP